MGLVGLIKLNVSLLYFIHRFCFINILNTDILEPRHPVD